MCYDRGNLCGVSTGYHSASPFPLYCALQLFGSTHHRRIFLQCAHQPFSFIFVFRLVHLLYLSLSSFIFISFIFYICLLPLLSLSSTFLLFLSFIYFIFVSFIFYFLSSTSVISVFHLFFYLCLSSLSSFIFYLYLFHLLSLSSTPYLCLAPFLYHSSHTHLSSLRTSPFSISSSCQVVHLQHSLLSHSPPPLPLATPPHFRPLQTDPPPFSR